VDSALLFQAVDRKPVPLNFFPVRSTSYLPCISVHFSCLVSTVCIRLTAPIDGNSSSAKAESAARATIVVGQFRGAIRSTANASSSGGHAAAIGRRPHPILATTPWPRRQCAEVAVIDRILDPTP